MSTRVALSLIAVMVSAVGCKCGEPPLVDKDVCLGVTGLQAGKTEACAATTDCADHFSCKAQKDKNGVQCCVFVDRPCVTEADCCAGQTCPENRKKCFDKFLACETDTDCGDKGDRFCEVYTDSYGSSSRCRFKTCGALGACPEGQSCFQGECMADLPCQGSCDQGKGCVPSTDRCQDYSMPTDRQMAACPMTCNAGFIATFKDNRNIWDSCNLAAVQCVCAELPGLNSEDLGRYSALAANPGKGVVASGYDGQYGDLVIFKYGADGKRTGIDYVDGVPAATVKYGPSGARGGVTEPGDDVGRYTDIAVANDKTYVSYYDVTHGDLKFAMRSGEGKWSSYTVDGAAADLGLYTSIAVDSDGFPGISYFQRGGAASFDATACPAPAPTGAKTFITALKFARATTQTPASPTDWVIKTVSCQSRPPPPCLSCGSSQVCADPNTGPDCFSPAATCNPTCDVNTETCITVGAVNKCAKKYNPANLNDVIDGVGLFSSLTFNGKTGYVAFMKRTTPPPMGTTKFTADGALYGVTVSPSNTPGTLVKLDDTGDTGFFPDVKIDPVTKNVAVAYHDFSSKQLKYYSATTFQTGVTPEVIDNGAGMTGSGEADYVGTDSALVFGSGAGQVYAVYQDATKGDLKLAKRGTTWQVLPSVSTNGAVGFFADGVFADGKFFASHTRIHARLIGGEPHVDNALILDVVPAN